jgi:hypothetical protein
MRMPKTAWRQLVLALGPFVTVLGIAHAGAAAEGDGDRPLNVCRLSDGASCEPADAGPPDSGATDDDASDARFEDAAPDTGADASTEDAAAAASADAGFSTPPSGSNGSSGCGCSVVGTESGGAGLLLASGVSGVIALLGARTRRSRRRASPIAS